MITRFATIERRTNETAITVSLDLDGPPHADVTTGLGFVDHMLTALAFHAGFSLDLICQGDLEIDDHHTIEDCGLALGQAVDQALGDRRGIARFGWAYAPLDEALARAVVDLSGRPSPQIVLGLTRKNIGAVATENIEHLLVSLAVAMRASVHIDVLRGSNDHHRAEAAFKALALALKAATGLAGDTGVQSTKGVL